LASRNVVCHGERPLVERPALDASRLHRDEAHEHRVAGRHRAGLGIGGLVLELVAVEPEVAAELVEQHLVVLLLRRDPGEQRLQVGRHDLDAAGTEVAATGATRLLDLRDQGAALPHALLALGGLAPRRFGVARVGCVERLQCLLQHGLVGVARRDRQRDLATARRMACERLAIEGTVGDLGRLLRRQGRRPEQESRDADGEVRLDRPRHRAKQTLASALFVEPVHGAHPYWCDHRGTNGATTFAAVIGRRSSVLQAMPPHRMVSNAPKHVPRGPPESGGVRRSKSAPWIASRWLTAGQARGA
jgi:hypothetical protein